ncbi:miraculin-like [Prosopis cineraria]|uniref:LOW QUALITY PROTEIN: miraculin-like n=1 Tax=Prosopis cineraria TaxID=364024 RepID=UPI00240EFF25|nr:LOW QUALITY PROTEIN: miraculin-like [Prosopis cineraria]XP_054797660.1 miraculin-like [Prosopis cineraria]
MKITLVAFALLFALTTNPLLGTAGPAPEQVVDTSGKILRAGANYYVIPVPNPNGGGLALASIGKTCPMDVVAVQGYRGLPLSFTPVNAKKGVIRVSTDLNVVFSASTDCDQSNVWKLDDYDDTTGQWFVTTGGAVGNPGPQTVSNWFKIEKYEESYKLVYCPSVCSYCNVQCKDIGIYADSDENQRLALSGEPYKVQFRKA